MAMIMSGLHAVDVVGKESGVAAVHNARLQNEAWSWFPCAETEKNRTDFQPTY
jgi:hypothetical protein